MTVQYSDALWFRGKDFELVGINSASPFDPKSYGMKPTIWSTACYRGYLATYEVKDRKLYIKKLEINLTEPSYGGMKKVEKIAAPPIGDISPIAGETDDFEYCYQDMNFFLPFMGGLLIGKDFIRELSVRMGFHPAWKYRNVHELIFKVGELVQESNVSEKMEQFRYEMLNAKLQPNYTAPNKEVREWIEKCFSRKYTL